ncbi:MAG: phospholipid carrier-dependent glycosyltransferase [Nitrospira sp.]|nr:phospholipid carrier-dependent glycosyltransferase [Nitrospira sp.]
MEKRHSLYIIAILLALSIFLTLINHIWIENNFSRVPPPWDTAWYIYMGLNDYDSLWNGGSLRFIKTLLQQSPTHAPLLPASAVPFFILFGPDINTAYLVNGLYLFILFIAVYCITENLAGSKAAMLSIFCTATFPSVIALSRDFLLEFPLTALTSVSYLFFIRSDSFRSRKDSIFFGLFSGLSVLTKTMGMIFFVMPFFYAFYIFFKGKGPIAIRKNIILTLFTAFIVASVYYIPNFRNIFEYLFYFGFGEGAKPYSAGISSLFSVENWIIYLKNITCRGISNNFTILFILSAVLFLFTKCKKFSRDYFIVWLWFICGYILLSLSINKGGDRYALPILPPLAILISVHISRISLKPARYIITAFILSAGILNYVYQSATGNCNYKEVYYKNTPVFVRIHTTCTIKNELQMPYDKVWDVEQILRAIDKLNQARHKTLHILIASDHHFLNFNTLMLYQKIDKIKGLSNIDLIFEKLPVNTVPEDEIRKIIDRNQFVITKDGFQGPVFSNGNNEIVKSALKDKTPLETFAMSDGSKVFLYSFMSPETQ